MTLNNIFDQIGKGYNNTRQADPFICETLYKFLEPQPGKLYLDLGCGTGNYTVCLADKGCAFWGIDPSELMLQQAKLKTDKINWLAGQAENIPVKDKTFNGAIATLTIHHWTNLPIAFNELYRVLKSKSKFVLFTSTPDQMQGYWLNHYFPDMMHRSNALMPSYEPIKSAMLNSGFTNLTTEKYFVQNDLKDLFLYSGKNNPELYFDPVFRQGISSFTISAVREEVETGLEKLSSDIKTGKFNAIRDSFENNLGDYLFIVAEKS